MTSFLHSHPWLVLLIALFVVFTLNAVVMWALARAAALGDRLRVLPPAQWTGEDRAPLVPSPVRADPMHEWDLEAGEYFSEWSR